MTGDGLITHGYKNTKIMSEDDCPITSFCSNNIGGKKFEYRGSCVRKIRVFLEKKQIHTYISFMSTDNH